MPEMTTKVVVHDYFFIVENVNIFALDGGNNHDKFEEKHWPLYGTKRN